MLKIRVCVGLMIVALLVVSGGVVQASWVDASVVRQLQPGEGITYGETVTGTLEVGARNFWTFSGEADDAVTISVESQDFDTYLELLDPNGVSLSQNDDSGGGLNSRLNYLLPEAGTYTIIVSSSFGNDGGDYSLSLEQRQALPSGGEIALNELVQSELWTSDGDRWTFDFEGDAETTIVIQMNSNDFDTYLELYDAEDQLVAENDDTGFSLNSRIIVQLTDPGTYTVLARGYHGDTGAYSLIVSDNAVQGQLTAGEAVQGELETNQIHIWQFTATAGTGVVIDMTSNAFDTYLELLGPDGTQLSENDDGGDGFNARVRYLMTEDGTYSVIARSYDDLAVGEYTLSLEVREDVGAGGGTIAYGETSTGELWSPDGDRWTFEGQAGDVVVISMDSEDFDAYLELRGPDDALLASDDDGGDGLNSQITYTLEESGTFVIVASSYNSQGTGVYTLELQQGAGGDSSSSKLS